MQREDINAYSTLREYFSDITSSSLDPGKLADVWYAAKLIDDSAVEQAGQSLIPRANRLRELLSRVLHNGKPGAFQDIVLAIKRDPTHEWLAQKLIDSYIEKGGKWKPLQSGSASSNTTDAMAIHEAAPPPTVNWQHQTMSRNSTGIIRALAANKLSESLADELKARRMIGDTVYGHATNHGPDIIEYTRVKHIVNAMLTSAKSNPQRYYDFITVLQLDGIRQDAETALALLPTDPPASNPRPAAVAPVQWQPECGLSEKPQQASNGTTGTVTIRKGDTPSLLTLRRFPGKRRKFNVLEGIGTHYRDFGTFLLDDHTGMKVAAIETARLRVSSLILQDVFEEWLLGRGKLPVTYATLVECLRAVELNVLADDILDVLQ